MRVTRFRNAVQSGVAVVALAVPARAQAARLASVEYAALVGVVLDGAGQPVVDAKVEVFECLGRGFACFDSELRAQWTPVASSPVDKAGRFGLQVPAGASLRVQVRHARFALWRVDEHVLAKELRIELQPPCTFRGRLVDAAGEGVPGSLRGFHGAVTDSFAGRTEIFRGRTDAAGNFAFAELPPGRFTCMVEPDSRVTPPWWKGELRADAVCEHTFVLQRGITLRGRVLDAASRQPIAGASIGEGWFLGRPVRSGADGAFALAGLAPGTAEVTCTADGFVRTMLEEPIGESDAKFDFELVRGAVVTGTLLDTHGKPAAGVYVAAAAFGRTVTWLPQRTGADGTFRCAGLPPGQGHLVVRAAGHAVAIYHLPSPDAELRIDAGALQLQPAHVVRASVRDAAGKPMAGVRMRLFGINADMERLHRAEVRGFGEARPLADRFAYSDADGIVCFGAVAAGNYQLGFDAEPQPMVPDDAIAFEVTADAAPKDLTVQRPK